VSVLYAADDGHGLSADPDDLWTQYTTSVKGKKEDGDGFGFALAVGDFNCSGYQDLAMGAPGEKPGDDLYRAGAVIVSPNDLEVRVRPNGIEVLALELQPAPADETVDEAVA
jgi:FG-GAP repeat